MKAIIDGKRYDTETATCIGKDSYSSRGDFQWWEESLFETKSGVFFLAGEGGARSSWAERRGQNEWGGGSGIRPMTKAEARAWAEHHLSAAQVEEAFADQIQDA